MLWNGFFRHWTLNNNAVSRILLTAFVVLQKTNIFLVLFCKDVVPDGDKDVVPDGDSEVRKDGGHNSVVEEVQGDDNVVSVHKDGARLLCSLFLLLDGGADAAELQQQQLLPEGLTHCPSL